MPHAEISQFDSPMGYRILLACFMALWLISYVQYRVLSNIHDNFFVGLLKFAPCYCLWLLLTPMLFRLERRFPLTRPVSGRNTLLFVVLCVPICYGTSLFALNTLPLLNQAFPLLPAPAPFTFHVRATEAELQVVLFVMSLGVSAFLRHLADVRQNQRQAAQLALEKAHLESALREAELETLRLRLNPHFLFNCLQNVSALAGEDPKAASTMLAQLGDLLRVALSDDYQSQITLHREIELTRAYLALEQIRFGDRLSALFSLDPLAERLQVPSLLLQPLVENALKHGLSRQGRGLLHVISSIEAGQLILTIRDNGGNPAGSKSSAIGFGVGLAATRERLRRMYGDKQSLVLQRLPEGGAEVRVSLPAIPVTDARTLVLPAVPTTQAALRASLI